MEQKKYFIGSTFNQTITDIIGDHISELSKKFGIDDVGEKHSAHLTNKIPFYATEEQILSLKEFLGHYLEGNDPIEITAWGFSHFSNHTVYMDIAPNQKILPYIIFQRRLYDRLYEKFSPWMTFGNYEPLELPHVTVAKKGIELKIHQMIMYLNSRDSSFRTFISNRNIVITHLALFEKLPEGNWIINEKFELKP